MKQLVNLFSLSLLSLLRLLFFYLAASVLLLTIILFSVVDNTAITESNESLNPSDLQTAKKIISKTTSKLRKKIRISEKDLNNALSHLLSYFTHSGSQITVEKYHLHFKISFFLKKNYFGKYLNFSFKLTKQQGYPIISTLQIGQIKITDEFAGLILESIIKYTPLNEWYILASQHIREIKIEDSDLTIAYSTPSELSLHDNPSLTNDNYEPVIFYQQQIIKIIDQHDPKWRLSLAELLQPLFKLAYQRSTKKNAISENRAVFIAVSTYVNKREIQAYLPINISPATNQQYPASLYRRTDLAKHFMISAVLAATGVEILAHVIGQEKELNDAKQGSGFSFIDLAGDRAGLRFGKRAVKSPKKARQFQKRMANIKDYRDFMPDFSDLPENMSEAAFKQEFESIYSAKYQKILKNIDNRISVLEIY
jgi:uncharacterized protein YfiM (DUF2279 family)